MFVLRALGVSCIVGAIAAHRVIAQREEQEKKRRYNKPIPLSWKPPTREEVIKAIQEKRYDIVIVGGGSAGAGSALDAASRGYSVLLLERNDFASGTSSKSTKLIHGGVRYLEKAIKEVDYRQLALVVEGLRERKSFLRLCPYLTREVGIILPVKNKFMLPYFWLGTKMYDILSGMYGIEKSRFIDKNRLKNLFPAIDQKKIAGCMVYFDGQMDDTRVNVMLAGTAAYYGADVLNYAEVTELMKKDGRISGVILKDKETDKTYSVLCSGVINATGPWSDEIREKDSPGIKKIMAPSAGAHIVIDAGYTPKYGMLNPSTKNGSVLFLLPWHRRSIAGTTDAAHSITEKVLATKKDVSYIINEMAEFISSSLQPKAKNIMSAWAGLRPLAMDPNAIGKGTQALVRSHLIETSSSGLITIAGGKWTSFRKMAEETITYASKCFHLPERECLTKYIRLIGSHMYSNTLAACLSRDFGLEYDIAEHLVSTYGDRAQKVCLYAGGEYKRIDQKYPYIKAEIEYSIDHEHTRKIEDFIGRRSLFAYFDVRRAHSSVEVIGKVFKNHLGWTESQLKKEKESAYMYLDTMGYSLLKQMEEEERKLEDFKKKCEKECGSDLYCSSKKAQSLIEKEYGIQERKAFVSLSHKRTSVSVADILKAVQIHRNTLY